MKRTLILLLSALWLFAGAVCAVEKKEKPKPVEAPKIVQPKPKPVTPAPAAKTTKPAGKDTKAKPAEKKYDDFIDLNHNGIDDRQENLVKKENK